MKGDYNWDSLELQVAGKDRLYKGVTVVPFIATVPFTAGDPESERLRSHMADPSCMLPAEVRAVIHALAKACLVCPTCFCSHTSGLLLDTRSLCPPHCCSTFGAAAPCTPQCTSVTRAKVILLHLALPG